MSKKEINKVSNRVSNNNKLIFNNERTESNPKSGYA